MEPLHRNVDLVQHAIFDLKNDIFTVSDTWFRESDIYINLWWFALFDIPFHRKTEQFAHVQVLL